MENYSIAQIMLPNLDKPGLVHSVSLIYIKLRIMPIIQQYLNFQTFLLIIFIWI